MIFLMTRLGEGGLVSLVFIATREVDLKTANSERATVFQCVLNLHKQYIKSRCGLEPRPVPIPATGCGSSHICTTPIRCQAINTRKTSIPCVFFMIFKCFPGLSGSLSGPFIIEPSPPAGQCSKVKSTRLHTVLSTVAMLRRVSAHFDADFD